MVGSGVIFFLTARSLASAFSVILLGLLLLIFFLFVRCAGTGIVRERDGFMNTGKDARDSLLEKSVHVGIDGSGDLEV